MQEQATFEFSGSMSYTIHMTLADASQAHSLFLFFKLQLTGEICHLVNVVGCFGNAFDVFCTPCTSGKDFHGSKKASLC